MSIIYLLALLWVGTITQASLAYTAMFMELNGTAKASQGLVAKACSQGAVRVIVSLNMAFLPEGELPDEAAVHKQRKTIASLQAKVLGKLRGCTVHAIRRYKYTPAIAMEVDACGVRGLLRAPEVSRVAEDIPVPPTQTDSR